MSTWTFWVVEPRGGSTPRWQRPERGWRALGICAGSVNGSRPGEITMSACARSGSRRRESKRTGQTRTARYVNFLAHQLSSSPRMATVTRADRAVHRPPARPARYPRAFPAVGAFFSVYIIDGIDETRVTSASVLVHRRGRAAAIAQVVPVGHQKISTLGP